uniref:Histone deacetylase domain-containing protein n=1 Tax=Dunaliella tertiolecta TaxID=3047 RepID=A0A7S3VQH8_DUNTE
MSERPLASINISDDNIAFTAALPCMQDLIIVDVFNGGIFPKDEDAWPAINVSVPLRSGAGDAEYLKAVRQALEDATQWPQPDLVFYNAGTDVLEGDPLGRFNISAAGIQQRDQMVFEHALHTAKAPIVMTLSGGYAPKSSDVISASLSNLIRSFQLNAIPGSSSM